MARTRSQTAADDLDEQEAVSSDDSLNVDDDHDSTISLFVEAGSEMFKMSPASAATASFET
jgi:hypothetical protein